MKAVQPRNNWVPVDAGATSGPWSCFVEAVAMPSFMVRREPSQTALLGDRATMGTEPLYVLGRGRPGGGRRGRPGPGPGRRGPAGGDGATGAYRPPPPRDPAGPGAVLDLYDLDGDGPSRPGMPEGGHVGAGRPHGAPHLGRRPRPHRLGLACGRCAETVRKCARTFSNVAALGEQYPELVFACSQAQQWWWMKQQYPAVFERMKAQVKKGQVVPVGGMWVESDTNVTGGGVAGPPARVRQAVLPVRAGRRDRGGVAAGLLRLFGRPSPAHPPLGVALVPDPEDFLERHQQVPPPHLLVGGHRRQPGVHPFPARRHLQRRAGAVRAGPRGQATMPSEGFGTRSLVPFGYGDGGGGPTREMMERARRLADLDGSPRVAVEAPSKFFAAAQAEYPDAPVWSGELYLELHRGTLTSQVEIKAGQPPVREPGAGGRAVVDRRPGGGRARPYPYDELEEIWRDILLNQFHDILPGLVDRHGQRRGHRQLRRQRGPAEGIIDRAITALCWPRATCRVVLQRRPATCAQRGRRPCRRAALVPGRPAPGERAGEPGTVLENDLIRVELDADGHIVSLLDRVTGREVIPPGVVGNVLQLHPDFPNKWPAWDIDRLLPPYPPGPGALRKASPSCQNGPDEAAVQVEYAFGSSRAVQTLAAGRRQPGPGGGHWSWTGTSTSACSRWLSPSTCTPTGRRRRSSSGTCERPTHTNTSWDDARFEFVAHRFVHVGEPGYGVAVVNGGIYGHEVTALGAAGRRTGHPGPAVRHPRRHVSRTPGATTGRIASATRSSPGRPSPTPCAHGLPVQPPAAGGHRPSERWHRWSLDNEAVVVEAVKAADDRSGDVVVRCYESLGGRATATLQAGFPVRSAAVTDLLERTLTDVAVDDDNSVRVQLRPFEVVTLRLSLYDHFWSLFPCDARGR